MSVSETKRSEGLKPTQTEKTEKEVSKESCNVSAWAALFFFVLAGVASLTIYACSVPSLYQVYPAAGSFISLMMGVRAICLKKASIEVTKGPEKPSLKLKPS
jgi:hypothetical protein